MTQSLVFHELIQFLKVCDLLVMDILDILSQVQHLTRHAFLLIMEPLGKIFINLSEGYLLSMLHAIHDLFELLHNDSDYFRLHTFL